MSQYLFYLGRQTVLVHHQTGIAAITVTALGYQVSHLVAAKVSSPVSKNVRTLLQAAFLFISSRNDLIKKCVSLSNLQLD